MGEKQAFVVKAEPKGLLEYLRHYSRYDAPRHEVPGWEHWLTDIQARWDDDGALSIEVVGTPKDEPDEAWTSDYPRLASLHAMPLGDGRTEVTLSACDELGPWAEDLAHRMIELWPEARSALPAEGGPTRKLGAHGTTLLRVKDARALIERGTPKTRACKQARTDIRTYDRYAAEVIDWENAKELA
jgi:hypothetical protein